MSDLSKQENIGKELEKKFIKVGINNFAELQSLGTEKAFIQLQAIDLGPCLNMLYAIEGAIQGIRWHNLTKERKQELKEFYNITHNE